MTETFQTSATLLNALRQQNDEQAWQRFMQCYERFIYSCIRKMNISEQDTLELTQAVIIRIWEKMPNFEYQKKQGKFRNWLFTVTRNETLKFLQKQQGQNRILEKYNKEQTTALSSFDWIDKEWQNYLVNEAFNAIRPSLSPKSIQIYLGLLKGGSPDELAEKFNVERNTVYVYKKRITKRLVAEVKRLEERML